MCWRTRCRDGRISQGCGGRLWHATPCISQTNYMAMFSSASDVQWGVKARVCVRVCVCVTDSSQLWTSDRRKRRTHTFSANGHLSISAQPCIPHSFSRAHVRRLFLFGSRRRPVSNDRMAINRFWRSIFLSFSLCLATAEHELDVTVVYES